MKYPRVYSRLRWFVIVVVGLLPAILSVAIKYSTPLPIAAVSQQITSQFGHTYIVQQEISFPASFNYIFQVVHAPIQNRLYVIGGQSPFFVVDLATSIASSPPNMPSIINRIAINGNGQRLYAREQNVGIRVYNTNNWSVIATINNTNNALDFLEVDGRLFVVDFGVSQIRVYNAVTGDYIENVNIPSGTEHRGFVVSPDHTTLYLHGSTTLHKFNITTSPITHQLSTVVGAALGDLAISSDGSQLVLTQYPSNSLYRFSSSNFALIDAIPAQPDEFIKSATYTDEMLVSAYALVNSLPVVHGFDVGTGQETHYFVDYGVPENIKQEQADLEPLDDNRLAMAVRVNGWPKVWVMTPTYYGVALPVVAREYCFGPFLDDFSDPSSGWPRGVNGNNAFNYVNNEYQIYQGVSDQWFAVSRGDRFGVDDEDQFMEIDTNILNGQDGTIGIIWGINEDWSDFYTFELWPNERYWLIFHFNGSTGWQLQSYGFSNSINRTGTNEITMYGLHTDEYQFHINDYYIRDVSRVMGRVGISAAAFDNNTTFRYDNYAFMAEGCHPDSLLPSNITFSMAEAEQRTRLMEQAVASDTQPLSPP